MLSLTEAEKPKTGLGEILNYAAMIAPGICLGKDGSITGGFWLTGKDYASIEDAEKLVTTTRLNDFLKKLPAGFVIHHDCCRIPVKEYPTSKFPDRISQLIDDERKDSFLSNRLNYDTVLALTVTYSPPKIIRQKIDSALYTGGTKVETTADKILEEFEHKLVEIQSELSVIFQVERMSSYESISEHNVTQTFDELLAYLNFCISGELKPIALPPCPMYLDAILGSHDLLGGLEPKLDDKHLAVVTIDGYPIASYPDMLSQLDQLDIPYRWSNRTIFVDKPYAQKLLKQSQKHWNQKKKGLGAVLLGLKDTKINQHAEAMALEVDDARQQLDSGTLNFAYFTSTITLLDTDYERLMKNVRRIRTEVSTGFNTRLETMNAVDAWVGSLPSHTWANVRRPILNTQNISDILPINTLFSGEHFCPCPYYPDNSPPLMMTKSLGHTPFRLNLHVYDVGHTLVVGPTGKGKSTLVATILAQFKRYPGAQVFAFDKGQSLYTICKATGGIHYDIAGSEEDNSPSFCPLKYLSPNDKNEIAWVTEWLCDMYYLSKGSSPSPQQRNLINAAVKQISESEVKSLTILVNEVQDSDIRTTLEAYTSQGSLGNLLDSESDCIQDSQFNVFEIEDLMNMGDKATLPVLSYLFHDIEKKLQGQPAIIAISEAWIALSHPAFKEKIREWLKVLRKLNTTVILDTQNISDLVRSGILDVIIESCSTVIYLPNEKALNPGTATTPGPFDYYKSFGLNNAQINVIASATPKRQYYYTSALGSRLFELGLGPKSLAFVAVDSKEDLAKVKSFEEGFGEDWQEEWLRLRGAI